MSRRDTGWVLTSLVGFGAILLFVAWRNWLAGDELYFSILAMLSAGVFAAAYFVSERQIAVEARKDLVKARDEIVQLKAKIEELKKSLAKAQDAQRRSSDGIETARASLQPTDTTELAVNSALAAQLTADAAESAASLGTVKLDSAIESAGAAIEQLPEGHRLAGWWVAVGLFLALLAFAVPADISISTSDPNTPPAEAGENGEDGEASEDSDGEAEPPVGDTTDTETP